MKAIYMTALLFLVACSKPMPTQSNLCKDLPKKNWAAFARSYNGPAYRKNNYDVKLQAAYEKASGCIK